MLVKIGNKIYNSEIQPIMLTLTHNNINQIRELRKEGKYRICFHPKGKSETSIKKFMEGVCLVKVEIRDQDTKER